MRKTAGKGLKFLVMSLTGCCNLACKYCYATGQAAEPMSFDTARRIIDMVAAGSNAWTLQFSGGEPLLEYDLLKAIVSYIKNKDIDVRFQLQTNGTLLTEEMARYFKREKIGIGVSLDGMPEVNDKTRRFPNGRGASASVLHGIELLKNEGVAIGLTSVLTSENVKELTKLVEFAYYLGNVRRLGIDLLRGQGRGENLTSAGSEVFEEYIRAFRRSEELAKLFGYKIKFSQVEQAASLARNCVGSFAHCEAMDMSGLHVDAKGRFYACSSFVGDEYYCVGDAVCGIDEGRWIELSAVMRERMATCQSCGELKSCGGACYARCVGNGGRPPCAECGLKKAAALLINFTKNY